MLKCKINYFCKVIIEILKKLFTTSFCLFALWASAQTGTKVYPFLNVPVSARQAVLGGDAVSVRDYDVNFAAINPALMNLDMDNRIGINYDSYIAGSNLGSINYVKDLTAGHFISVNARVLDFGKTPRTDEFGNVNGEFSAMDASSPIPPHARPNSKNHNPGGRELVIIEPSIRQDLLHPPPPMFRRQKAAPVLGQSGSLCVSDGPI